MAHYPTSPNFNRLLFAGLSVVTIAVFVIDVQFPLGVAGGIPYVLIVMATYWIRHKYTTTAAGILATLLIFGGYVIGESEDYIFLAGINRLMSIIVIWASVWFVNNYKASLERIQKNEKRISALFEAATEGIIISDLDGKIVMVNEKTEELFGYSREEIIGEKIEILVPNRYRKGHRGHRQEYYHDPEPRPMGQGRDLYGLTKDQEEFPVEISLNHFETEGGRFIISYVIDITQRKVAEDELLEAHRELKQTAIELKQSNEELEQFVYVASHDLQEPLRMVASYTQLLERRYKDQLDEDAHDFINYAVDGAQRMQQLLNDLLQFSRVGTRAKPYKRVAIDEVVQDALQNLHKFIQDHDAEVIIETPLPEISIDKLQLTQLFQNLIHNAIKFKGSLPPRVWINAKELDDRWEFSIADNGVGLDLKHKERIFAIFQRLHNRTEYEGSGIGLSICKKIVERHGGHIWVDSTPGEGATFYFTIAKGLSTSRKNNSKETIVK